MIGGYSSPSYAGTLVADLILFLVAVPFGVCDLYYSYRDFTCVYAPITNYSIRFPLQTWLRVDGGVLLGMSGLILLLGLVLCCNPLGSSGLFWVHNVLGFLLALFRLAWLVIGSVMFWGYLNKYHICGPPVSRYMWVNLIVGFVHSFLYFCLPCLCGLLGRPGLGAGFGGGISGGISGGMGAGVPMTPLPATTPSIRETRYAIY